MYVFIGMYSFWKAYTKPLPEHLTPSVSCGFALVFGDSLRWGAHTCLLRCRHTATVMAVVVGTFPPLVTLLGSRMVCAHTACL